MSNARSLCCIALFTLAAVPAFAAQPPRTWDRGYPAAARELAAWMKAHPDAAALLVAWDDEQPAETKELVLWALNRPRARLEKLVAAHPNRPRLQQFAADAQAAEAFLKWARANAAAADGLVARPKGFVWAKEQLVDAK